MIRTKTRIRFEKIGEAANEQPGADEQNQREGKFDCHEKSLEAV